MNALGLLGFAQRIVAQMHEILQSKNAKIEKLEIVINELQDACTAVLEEELEALHRHRKWLEVCVFSARCSILVKQSMGSCDIVLNSCVDWQDEMAAVDEMISAKTAKLEELREETAKISNLVHEDDITKAVGMPICGDALRLPCAKTSCLTSVLRRAAPEVFQEAQRQPALPASRPCQHQQCRKRDTRCTWCQRRASV